MTSITFKSRKGEALATEDLNDEALEATDSGLSLGGLDPMDEHLEDEDAQSDLDAFDEHAETDAGLLDGVDEDLPFATPSYLSLTSLDDLGDGELDPDLLAEYLENDDRLTDDFDFASMIAQYSPVDIDGTVRALDTEKVAFAAAYRREGRKGSAIAEFYNVANTPIFRRRAAIQARIVELEALDDADSVYEADRMRSHLEYVTELLVRFNYGMTRSYVRKFTSNTSAEDSADFQGAANVGLMHAISTFDPDRGRFGSWSFKPIQRAVLKAVQQADFNNMTGGDFERRPQVLRAYAKLAGPDQEHTPTMEEIAKEAEVTVALAKRVLEAPHIDSLHSKVGYEDTTELGDLIADSAPPVDESIIAEMEIRTLMEYGLPVLDPRERYVLVCRYGIHGEAPEALSDIGKRLGLSREAVRQIAGKALARLSHPMVLGALARGGRT